MNVARDFSPWNSGLTPSPFVFRPEGRAILSALRTENTKRVGNHHPGTEVPGNHRSPSGRGVQDFETEIGHAAYAFFLPAPCPVHRIRRSGRAGMVRGHHLGQQLGQRPVASNDPASPVCRLTRSAVSGSGRAPDPAVLAADAMVAVRAEAVEECDPPLDYSLRWSNGIQGREATFPRRKRTIRRRPVFGRPHPAARWQAKLAATTWCGFDLLSAHIRKDPCHERD